MPKNCTLGTRARMAVINAAPSVSPEDSPATIAMRRGSGVAVTRPAAVGVATHLSHDAAGRGGDEVGKEFDFGLGLAELAQLFHGFGQFQIFTIEDSIGVADVAH